MNNGKGGLKYGRAGLIPVAYGRDGCRRKEAGGGGKGQAEEERGRRKRKEAGVGRNERL